MKSLITALLILTLLPASVALAGDRDGSRRAWRVPEWHGQRHDHGRFRDRDSGIHRFPNRHHRFHHDRARQGFFFLFGTPHLQFRHGDFDRDPFDRHRFRGHHFRHGHHDLDRLRHRPSLGRFFRDGGYDFGIRRHDHPGLRRHDLHRRGHGHSRNHRFDH